ncbi:acyl carrier protein [bacterium]|nr:acyl carrier protein [bacterium]
MDEQTFYEKYFKAQGIPVEVVVGVRRILEECLEADFSRLTDEDDFSKDLRFFWDYDSMAAVMVITDLEKEFAIELSDDDTRDITTVRQMIEKVWEKVREKRV